MKKTLLTTLAIAISLNANYLKDDEFDINKLGKVFENYIQKTDKKFHAYDNKIIENQQKIQDLSKKIIKLELKLEQSKTKKTNEISTQSIATINEKEGASYNKDKRIVKTKKGIIAYSAPFSEDDLYLKRYDYKITLEIEFCNQYGWCKLQDKEEYVAEYLLNSNENN